jgi:hypothetical protein
MIRALRAAGLAPLHYLSREAALRVLLGQFAPQGLASRVLKSWLGLATVTAHRVLSEQGLCPTLIAGRRSGIDLPAALSEVAAWGHWEVLRSIQALPQGWAQVVHSYEQQRPLDEKLMRAVLAHFICWLGGVRWQ